MQTRPFDHNTETLTQHHLSNICFQCGRLTPEWEKLAKKMKGTAKIAYWDTEQGANPPRLIGQIKGTPTIKLFYPKAKKNKNNKKKIALDYGQAREMAPMKAYVESKIPNFVEKIVDTKQHEKYSDKATRNGLPQVLVFSKSSGTTPLLKYASTEYRRRLLIGEVKQTKKNQALYKKYKIDSAPAMIIIKPDGEIEKYDKGKFSFHKVINWMGKHALKEAVVPKKKEYTPEELEAKAKKKEEKKAKKKAAEEKKKVKSEERKKKKVAEEEKKNVVDGDDLEDDEL
tara:strand:+ start:198 stop:1052 length:855 start_codon:yes stop_codon:yes gene_type:complete